MPFVDMMIDVPGARPKKGMFVARFSAIADSSLSEKVLFKLVIPLEISSVIVASPFRDPG